MQSARSGSASDQTSYAIVVGADEYSGRSIADATKFDKAEERAEFRARYRDRPRGGRRLSPSSTPSARLPVGADVPKKPMPSPPPTLEVRRHLAASAAIDARSTLLATSSPVESDKDARRSDIAISVRTSRREWTAIVSDE